MTWRPSPDHWAGGVWLNTGGCVSAGPWSEAETWTGAVCEAGWRLPG